MNATMSGTTASQPRPVLVTVLAIFTIVGTVFTFGYAGLTELLPELKANNVPLPAWINVLSYILAVGKLVAAILLIRMKRIGFYLYAALEGVSAVLSIIGGKIGVDYMDTGFVNPQLPFDPTIIVMVFVGVGIGLSIAFIGGYAAHLSKMN